MSNVGIIGAGNVGEALARLLVQADFKVMVANSRGRDSLAAFAKTTGAEAVNLDDLASNLDFLIIAVPMIRIGDLPKGMIKSLSSQGAVIIDAGNYYPLRDGAIQAIDEGLIESQWVSQQLGVPIVKVFNNIIASKGVLGGRPKKDIALPVAADDAATRTTVMTMVQRMGFHAHDAGTLADSWRQQPGQPVYCSDPTLEEIPRLLQRADRKKAPLNRDDAWKILAKLPPHYSSVELVRVIRFSVGLDTWKPVNWLAALRLYITLGLVTLGLYRKV